MPKKKILKNPDKKLESLNIIKSSLNNLNSMEKEIRKLNRNINRIKDIQNLGKILIHISNHKVIFTDLLKEIKDNR